VSATALVTGGTGGLGVAVVERFLAAGWRVVVPSTDPDAASRLPTHAALDVVRADLLDPSDAQSAAGLAGADRDRPLKAVANLVGGFAADGRVHETPVEAFESQLRLNLRATYLTCQAALPLLMGAGGGAITCVSSRAAVRPFPGAAGYVTSKAGVLALVDAMAVEYLRDGVRVNAVLPSIIDTPAQRASSPDADFARWVQPAQIAEVVHFLSSDAASAVSGAHVPVYGLA
jgi:NAD(P)-dependent dehydrogenase (short-subunit alcohol dehydrogenase family)